MYCYYLRKESIYNNEAFLFNFKIMPVLRESRSAKDFH